jgi:ribosomal protein L7Ae-like RNA K-turn-binding protein
MQEAGRKAASQSPSIVRSGRRRRNAKRAQKRSEEHRLMTGTNQARKFISHEQARHVVHNRA